MRGVRTSVLAIGVLTGCAIQTPHLAIHQWPMANHVAYYHEALPYRVAVLPLHDQRPAQERRGQAPRGLFLLVWNQRVGDYYTGDHLFSGEIGPQLGQQLAEYLRAANVFTDVRYASSAAGDADAIRQVSQQQGVDYLLGGDLEHFFGSQHQEFSMYVLPLPFLGTFGWQNGKTLPWGQTTFRATLYDGRTGDMIWQNELEATKTLPRATDSMTEAAMQSFAAAAGYLSSELRQLPLATER